MYKLNILWLSLAFCILFVLRGPDYSEVSSTHEFAIETSLPSLEADANEVMFEESFLGTPNPYSRMIIELTKEPFGKPKSIKSKDFVPNPYEDSISASPSPPLLLRPSCCFESLLVQSLENQMGTGIQKSANHKNNCQLASVNKIYHGVCCGSGPWWLERLFIDGINLFGKLHAGALFSVVQVLCIAHAISCGRMFVRDNRLTTAHDSKYGGSVENRM